MTAELQGNIDLDEKTKMRKRKINFFIRRFPFFEYKYEQDYPPSLKLRRTGPPSQASGVIRRTGEYEYDYEYDYDYEHDYKMDRRPFIFYP